MAPNSLKVGGLVSLAATLFFLWSADSSHENLDPTAAAATHSKDRLPGMGDSLPPRRELLLRGNLAADARMRPRPTLRRLHVRRDPALEADPEFQRLMAIDGARKMALLQGDVGELQQMREQVRGAKVSRRVLEQALLDPNREVRLAALDEISLEMDEPPIELVGPVVEADPDPEVRLEALAIVADIDGDEADAVIDRAMNDRDDTVRDEARELMESRAEESR